MFEYKIVDTEDGLKAIEGDWLSLYERASLTPFSNPEFTYLWWKYFGKHEGRRLHIICGYEDGKLVGVLPLAIIKRKGLRFLHWAGNDVCDYCDVLVEKREHADLLWDAARKSKQYDLSIIEDVRPDAVSDPILAKFASKHRTGISYYLDINWKSGKEWFASLSRPARSKYTRRVKHLQERGPVAFEMRKAGEVPGNIVEDFLKLKIKWAETFDKNGIFKKDSVSPYFREFFSTKPKGCELLVFYITCNESTVAVMSCITHKGKAYGYSLAYNPEWGEFSPGNMVSTNLVSYIVDNGFSVFDFLRGDEPYKLRYTNNSNPLYEYTFSRNMLGGLGLIYHNLRREINNIRRARAAKKKKESE